MSEFRVYIQLENFEEEPAEISKLLELNPTSSGVLGEIIPGREAANIRYKRNFWRLESRIQAECEDIYDHMDELWATVGPHAKNFDSLPGHITKWLNCVLYLNDDIPSLHFRKFDMEMIDRLGLEMDIDIIRLG